MAEDADFNINIKVKGEQEVTKLTKDVAKLSSAILGLEKIDMPKGETGKLELGYVDLIKNLKATNNAFSELKDISNISKEDLVDNINLVSNAIAKLNYEISQTNKSYGDMEEATQDDYEDRNRIVNSYKRQRDELKSVMDIMRSQLRLTTTMTSKDKNRVGVIESMMRRYRWFQSLILVTLNFLRVLGGQSKVLDSMMGMIGTGLGYILNMILLPLLPLAIGALWVLLKIGGAIKWMNEQLKIGDWNVPIGSVLALYAISRIAFAGMGIFFPQIMARLAEAWAAMVANMSSNWLIFKKMFDFSALSMGGLFLGVVVGMAAGWLILGQLLKQDWFNDFLHYMYEMGAAAKYVVAYIGEAFQRLGSYIFEGKFLRGHDIMGELGGLWQGYQNAFQAGRPIRDAVWSASGGISGVYDDINASFAGLMPTASAGAYDTVPEFEQYTFNIDEIKVEGVKDADEFMREFEPEFEKMLERVNARSQIGSGTY